MKRLFILLLITILVFPGCNENEFLTETPKDDIFADNLFLSNDGFQNALYGLYALAREEMTDSNNPQYLWKLGVDNAFCGFEKGNEAAFNDYNKMNSETGIIMRTFEWAYSVVNTANTIISRAEGDVDWQGGSDAEDLNNKNKVLAHARLIRANAYRHLTGCWGAVPVSTEEINGLNYRNDWERTPVADIQDVMEQDWIFAKDNLEMVEMTGFANSAVASHYLAELYLTQERYAEAETEAKRVINSDEYSLMTERFGSYDHIPNPQAANEGVVFMDLFASPSREEGNMEVLWTINNANYLLVGSVTGGSKNTWNTYGSKSSELKSLNAETIYWFNGGRGRGRGTVSDSAFLWFEPTDDRYSEYAVKKYYIYPSNDEETEFEIKTHTAMSGNLKKAYLWPWPRKYEYVDLSNRNNSDFAYSYRPEMFLRLANTYLILAEALHKNGNNNAAAEYINEVRLRSNASPITASDVSIEFILKERSRELMTEEDRRYALNRNNVFVEWASKYNPLLEYGATVYDHNNILPIPQNIIDSNTGAVMEQNPDYN
jgi:hypothetical protein